MRGGFVVFFVFICVVDVLGTDIPQEIKKRAESAYLQNDFDTAFAVLVEIPDLLGVVPILDHPQGKARAEIFFDLARIRLAQGDTSHARSILSYIFELDREARNGILDLERDEAHEQTRAHLSMLRREERQRNLSSTTFMGAAGRSLVLPGWGQLYRGHRKRAFAFMGATAAAAVYWFAADRAYKSAYSTYRSTQIGEINVEERTGSANDLFPFQKRYQDAESKASRANVALGLLAGVWLAGVFDHVMIGPANLSVSIPIF